MAGETAEEQIADIFDTPFCGYVSTGNVPADNRSL
jgi:hypothetical protein